MALYPFLPLSRFYVYRFTFQASSFVFKILVKIFLSAFIIFFQESKISFQVFTTS